MFKKYAYKYYERDIPCVPIKYKEKYPVVQAWQDPSTHQYAEWENAYAGCGIGILLGKCSGVIAVDIDKDEALFKVPMSPVVKRGAKGETRFFRYNGEQASKRHDLGIEILSTGNQTVMPPSIHPSGSAYKWTSQATLEDFDLDELPILDPAFLKSLGIVQNQVTEGRHNTLIKFMGGKISDAMDREQAIKEVFEYDQMNHTPPYFTDTSETHKGRGLEAAAKMYESVKKTAVKSGSYIEPFELLIDLREFNKSQYKESFQKLPKLEGIGKMLFEDIYHNSPIPRSQFSYMAALQILSSVIGPTFSFKGIHANLYQYAQAPSAYGKDASLRFVSSYLSAIDERLMGGQSPTSESIARIYLEEFRSRCFVVNEAESLIKRMEDGRMNHGLKEFLTDAFDLPGREIHARSMLSGKGKQTELYTKICNPFVSLFFASTPSGFEECASATSVRTGFWSRFLFYFEDRYKGVVEHDIDTRPKELIIGALKRIYGITPLVDVTGQPIDLVDLKPDSECQALLSALLTAFEQYKQENANSDFFSLISRKMIYVYKFTVLHHFMTQRDPHTTTYVNADSLKWANAAVSAIFNNMLIKLSGVVHENYYDKSLNRVLRYVRKKTKEGGSVSMMEISNGCRSIRREERQKILLDLLEQGSIIKEGKNIKAV